MSVLLVSVSVRSPRREDPVARVVLDALAPLQIGVAAAQTAVRNVWNHYIWLVETSRENERLRERVAVLEREATHLEELRQSNKRLESLLQFRHELDGEVYGARVVGRDPLLGSRTMTVDRGRRDGVRRGMAVLSPQGVVGQIIEIGWTTSRVLVLTDHNSGIDALVQRSRARGIVQGDMENGCRMKYLRRGEDVMPGDRVVTSGMDGIFPKGLLIGEVKEVSRGHRGLLQVATVVPTAPLDRIEEVLIVSTDLHAERGGR